MDTTGVNRVQAHPFALPREPEAPSGAIKQVDWAVEGASVYVRNVYRGELCILATVSHRLYSLAGNL